MPKVRWLMLNDFVATFTGFPAMQNFENRYRFDSYKEFKGGNFFETQCS